MSGSPLVITVFGTPAPQGSKRHVGNGVMVESSAKVKPWREAVKHAALDVIDSVMGPAAVDAVLVDVTFTLQRPKGHYRTGRNLALLRDAAPAYPAGKPDLDKLLRSTLDALGDAGVWRDDAQVVAVTTRKVYGEVAGARIQVQPILADDFAQARVDAELEASIARHPAGRRRP